MALVLDSASWLLIALGGFFVVVGAVGLVRMPEFYTRIHAVSVIDTLGAGLLVLGMMLQAGWSLAALKLLFILGLFFFTGPVVVHALARAALHEGVKPLLSEDRRSCESRPDPPGDRRRP